MKRNNIKLYLLTAVMGLLPTQTVFGQFKAYDSVSNFDKYGYAQVSNNIDETNCLMGLIDKSGKEIIPLRNYSYIEVCTSDLVVVTEASDDLENEMKALYSISAKKQITPMIFCDVHTFVDGEAIAETENGNVVINSQGKVIRKLNLPDPIVMGDGFIRVDTGEDEVMFYNSKGEQISKTIFRNAYIFDDFFVEPINGWLQVWLPETDEFSKELSYFLSNKGELLSVREYEEKVGKAFSTNDYIVSYGGEDPGVLHFGEGKYHVSYDKEMNEFIVLPTYGEALFHFKADDCHNGISDDRVFVKRKGKWGCLDMKGNEVIKCTYDDVCSVFSEGLALVRDNNSYWFIDTNGKKVIDYTEMFANYEFRIEPNGNYVSTSSFEDGLAPFKKNKRVGFINKKGEIVIPAQYMKVGPFKNGFAVVEDINSRKCGMIDKSGKSVIPCEYETCSYGKEGFSIVTLSNNKQTFIKLPL